MQQLLFKGEVDDATGRPRSVFSNRLVVTAQSFVDSDKLDKVDVSRSFRGRDLRQAVLAHADLRKAELQLRDAERPATSVPPNSRRRFLSTLGCKM